MQQKIKLIYIPFLIITVGFVGVYTFLNWLLFIKFSSFNVQEDLVQLWLPFALPYIPIILWLRKRVKLLQFKRTARDPVFLYLIFAGFAISAPTIISQKYLAEETGKITVIKSIDEIDKLPATKFYSLKSCYVNKNARTVQYSADVSGKYNESLNLHIYIASPVYDIKDETTEIGNSDNDTTKPVPKKYPLIVFDGIVIDSSELAHTNPENIANVKVLKGMAAVALYGLKASNGVMIITSKKHESGIIVVPPQQTYIPPKAWLCVTYGKTISNHETDEAKTSDENDFSETTFDNYKARDLNSFIYLESAGNNSARNGYIAAIRKADPSINSTSNIFILEPKFEQFNKRTGSEFPWIFGSFAIGALVWMIMILIPKLDDQKVAAFLSGDEPTEKKTNTSFLNFFKPGKVLYTTPIIIDVNIIVFILCVVSGFGFIQFSSADLLNAGANFRPYTTNGQWWRLITSMFLHGGLMHILSNMIALLFIGILLEPKLGKKRFAIFYLITGILSSAASIWWHENTVSVGASGAIFGMYGIFVALLLMKVFPKEMVKSTLASMFIFIIYNLVMGLAGGIDNAAHVGGLLSGFIIGLFISPVLKRESEQT